MGPKTINAECNMCCRRYKVEVLDKDYEDWKNGEGYIQDLMPYLSPGERELLISGYCGECFDEIFDIEDE